jgi:hypothetical protein
MLRPVRTLARLQRKRRDRRARWNGSEHAQGWHRQHDDTDAAQV